MPKEAMKSSEEMEATIARMEKKWGKLNRDYFVKPIYRNRVGNGFYDGCILTSEILTNPTIVVCHDGTWYKV